jgi:murein DD-endopeptidase MepM/ murein hydrolase activator NlpD
MPQRKYYYNPKTLRFERARVSILKHFSTGLGYLAFGFLFFVGLLILQNYFTSTPLEKSLRTENRDLKSHGQYLNEKISNSNKVLATLKEKDGDLYRKIFDTEKPVEEYEQRGKEEILTASTKQFNDWTESITHQFNTLANKAKGTNLYYSWMASVDREDFKNLLGTPSHQPVENFEVAQLVSGFGMRINPFHKGNTQHDGVDISAPSGTPVLAAAPGRIILTKRSDLLAGFGNYIEIDHGNGYVTRYGHLENITVRIGQVVTKGQTVGSVGKSGGAIAPHLHYEVIKEGKNVDPVEYMVAGLNSGRFNELVRISKKVNQSLD